MVDMACGFELQTNRCVHVDGCGKVAVQWGGHVHNRLTDDQVTAGWCDEHRDGPSDYRAEVDCAGCFGSWSRSYGRRAVPEVTAAIRAIGDSDE